MTRGPLNLLLVWVALTFATTSAKHATNAAQNLRGDVGPLEQARSKGIASLRRKLGFVNKNCREIKDKDRRKECKRAQKKARKKARKQAQEEAANNGRTNGDEDTGNALPGPPAPTNTPTSLPTDMPTMEPTNLPSKQPLPTQSPEDFAIPPIPGPGGGGGGKGSSLVNQRWVWLSEYRVWFKLSTPKSFYPIACNPDDSAPATNADGEESFFPCPVPLEERNDSGLAPTSTCEDSHQCQTGCCMPTGVVSPLAVVNLCLYYEAHAPYTQCVYTTPEESEGRGGGGGGGGAIGGGSSSGSQNSGTLFEGERCEDSSECRDDCCYEFGAPYDGPVCVATFGYLSDLCIRV